MGQTSRTQFLNPVVTLRDGILAVEQHNIPLKTLAEHKVSVHLDGRLWGLGATTLGAFLAIVFTLLFRNILPPGEATAKIVIGVFGTILIIIVMTFARHKLMLKTADGDEYRIVGSRGVLDNLNAIIGDAKYRNAKGNYRVDVANRRVEPL